VKKLIQQGTRVNTTNRNNQTALYVACENGHTEVAQYLLDNGASVNLGAKPLIAAVRYNHYDCVKLLLQHHAFVNCTNNKSESPMSVALQKRHYSIILLLVQYDAIPSTSLGDIAVQLLKHAKVEHAKAVQKLIDMNLIDLASENTFLAAFGFAFKRSSLELAERMLSNDSYSKLKQLYPEAAYYSAKNNWPTILSKLFAKGVDINAITDGQTPLYVACEKGRESIVKLLLSNNADPHVPAKLIRSSKNLSSPLQVAVQSGNAMIVDMLLEKGAEMNPPGEPLLHIACSDAERKNEDGETRSVERMISIIRLLLQQGLNVNAVSDRGDTALYHACKSEQLEVVQILLEAGADVNLTAKKLYPLYAACERGHAQIVDLLLRHGADPNASSVSSERYDSLIYYILLGMPTRVASSDSLPIVCAVQKGYSDIFNLLLKHGADVNKQDDSGKSALITFIELMASRRSKTNQVSNPPEESEFNILKSMLLAGGDANMLSRYCSGHNALHIASSVGMCDVMMELIQHGADCNRTTSSGKSARDLACEKGHEEAVELLLKNGAKPDRKISTAGSTRSGYSSYDSYQSAMPVLCTAVKSGNERMVKMLLEHGANVNESDEKGNTALHLATSSAVIEMLLNAGANVSATNDKGETALRVICEKPQAGTNIVEMLLKYGADPNTCFPLHSACKNNDAETVRLLLAHGADANLVKNSVSERLLIRSYTVTLTLAKCIEPSPLCLACKNGNKAIVDCLLTNGAATALADSDGNTPLHFAVSRLGDQLADSEEYDPIVTVLLEHKTPVNVVSDEGETPLYVACSKGLAGVVKQLMDCNAAVGLTTSNSNKYPLSLREKIHRHYDDAA